MQWTPLQGRRFEATGCKWLNTGDIILRTLTSEPYKLGVVVASSTGMDTNNVQVFYEDVPRAIGDAIGDAIGRGAQAIP